MNRVQREKIAYNSGLLRRTRYEELFQRSIIDSEYLDSIIQSHITYADEKLVLELGSNAWIGYLRDKNIRPKKLYCINVSAKELNEGVQYQQSHNIPFPIEFILMDANQPAFDEDQFDFVFGGAILHHLDTDLAIKNISALIKPGGRILLHEPLGVNPVAKIIRAITPFARTSDERPLSIDDIKTVKKYFDCRNYVSGGISTVLAVLTNLLANRTNTFADKWANRADQILSNFQFLRPFYREIIIVGQKRRP